ASTPPRCATPFPYTTLFRSVILRLFARATIIDLAHGLQPYAILQAAFLLEGAWREFPSGTVHVAVVDPGVGGQRKALALSAGERSEEHTSALQSPCKLVCRL